MANTKLKITYDGWSETSIKELLASNPNAVLRAILAIYNLQEPDEKMMGVTTHENKVGFNAYDAELLTKCAIQLNRTKKLHDSLYYQARRKIFKYSKQLTNIANNNTDVQGRWNV
jgi:hypothetical protein